MDWNEGLKMAYLAVMESFRVRDAVDILFMSVMIYHLYTWFHGTQAFKALVGLVALGVIYTGARLWGLFLTTWSFQILWQVLVILLIILFQSEIRQALGRVNPLRIIGLHAMSTPEDWIPRFVEAVFTMAERRIGALLVIERMDELQEWVTACFPVTGPPTPELLVSLFQKDSPLHDGAALIKGGKLLSASCYLPLTSAEGLPNEWGTRHRAALGLSERCDAWVVVISEERGEVSLAREGQMERMHTQEELSRQILEGITPARRKLAWRGTLQSLFTYRWQVKLGTLALVCGVWLLLAGEQNYQVVLDLPVQVKGIPGDLEVASPENPRVRVTFEGLRKNASTLNSYDVSAVLDGSYAQPGREVFGINAGQIHFPRSENLRIVNIAPDEIEFTFKKKS
jgi:diadenylate cyclase